MTKKLLLFIQIFWIIGCSTSSKIKENTVSKTEISQVPILSKYLGKKVTFTGETLNCATGAALQIANGPMIWLDKLNSWPEGFFLGENNKKNKIVKISGTLIEKFDLPVFIDDGSLKHGIPVPIGTDLGKLSHRYLLTDYTWEIENR
ncbi:hypothetical protein OX283_011250 [Flavobacterium sp. SUN052]|uniref:hypothetical protein n=1 Tax=Flavobacterium sp. SUN052 TaxID=3002441 RepID=UPI00237DE0B8|nr:hypothetical protein [Flavobacterium sp. SUN052]MEC4005235.1 hypothetical protein [Flavobacterium sp. SUN052]